MRDALCHRAGVPAIREPLTERGPVELGPHDRGPRRHRAWWEPGTRHGYHTNTYGFLVGEIVRRVTGELPGDAAARALAGPLGADVWFGVPGGEQRRCAEVDLGHRRPRPATARRSTASRATRCMNALGYFNPPGYSSIGVVNTPAWRAAQVPSTNGHGTAARRRPRSTPRSLEPGALLSPDLLAEATRAAVRRAGARSSSDDVTFGLGFQPTTAERARSARTRGASATSAPAAPSGSPTPTPASPSAT